VAGLKPLHKHWGIPCGRVSLSKFYERFVRLLVTLLQNKEREEMINCGLHDLAHFSLSNVGVLRITVTYRAVLPRVDIFYRAIAEG